MENAPRPVTLKSMATRLGVSHSTVSLALRNDRRISAAMREKVQALAQQLGYRPDPALSALISYRQSNRPPSDYGKLAILNAWGVAEAKLPYFFKAQLSGVREQARALGYETELFALPRDERGQRQLSRMLEVRGIRGIVIGPVPAELPPPAINWERFCVICIGYSLPVPKFHRVANNHHASALAAYQKLRELGYRRIGFHNLDTSEHRNRGMYFAAYLKSVAEDGIPLDKSPPLFMSATDTADVAGWVRKHKYDAVISGLSLRLFELLAAAGMRVPEDIGVAAIGTGDSTSAAMAEDQETIGESAVFLLHTMLLHGERGIPAKSKTLLIDPFWRDGPTVRNLGGRPS